MPFDIRFAPEALDDFKSLSRAIQSTVKAAMETHLRAQPEATSKSRIKRLRGLRQPRHRLRVDQIRIFYDVDLEDMSVDVLRILPKAKTMEYLKNAAKYEKAPPHEGEG